MLGQTLLQDSAIRSLCILRLSAIGDVCHAVSMVQAIQRQRPDIKITWIIGKIEAQLLGELPNIEFVIFDKATGLRSLLALRRQLQKRKFDVLFHMQVAIRASLVSKLVNAKVRVGFDRARAKEGQWLFCNAQIAPQKAPHVLEGFAAFAKAIGVDALPPKWDIPVAGEDEAYVMNLVGKHAPFAVISPVASNPERNWSLEGYVALAENLTSRGLSVVLTSAPMEKDICFVQKIIQACSVEVYDLAGKTNLPQLLALFKHAHLVLAPDSGPAHIAVTVGTPVVGLYAHSNPRRTGPYAFQPYVVNHYDKWIEQQRCRGWQDLPWGTRAKGQALMDSITVEEVIEKIDRLIEDFYPAFASHPG